MMNELLAKPSPKVDVDNDQSESSKQQVKQLKTSPGHSIGQVDTRPNNTGMPDNLKSGIERLSGYAMDDVKVHYNSAKPAQLQAHAYAQGTDIHIGPGQERHLPHEAWHVVQQKQGRVQPTIQMKSGVPVNDDAGLEREADVMGARALQFRASPILTLGQGLDEKSINNHTVQRRMGVEFETGIEARISGHAPPFNHNGHVAQDEVMHMEHGWRIVSDNSKLEFVVEPPATNAAALRPIMASMMSAVTRIKNRITHNPEHLHNILKVPTTPPPHQYILKKNSRKIVTGSMQGTIGVPFERLFEFFEILETYKLSANKELVKSHEKYFHKEKRRHAQLKSGEEKTKLGGVLPTAHQGLIAEKSANKTAISRDNVNTFADIREKVNALCTDVVTRANNFHDGHRANEIENVNKLKGLLHFVGQYVVFAANYRSSYKKKSFPVMSRSSFRSMYSALHKKYYKKQFNQLAPRLVNQLGYTLDREMFNNATVTKGADAEFTIGEWLDSIKQGVTRNLPDGSRLKADRMTAPDVYGPRGHDTDKSLGGMGLDGGKVVVELRTIKHLAELATHEPYMALCFVNDLARLDL